MVLLRYDRAAEVPSLFLICGTLLAGDGRWLSDGWMGDGEDVESASTLRRTSVMDETGISGGGGSALIGLRCDRCERRLEDGCRSSGCEGWECMLSLSCT